MIDLASLAPLAMCLTTPARWPTMPAAVGRQFAARGIEPSMVINGGPDSPKLRLAEGEAVQIIYYDDPPGSFRGRPGSWWQLLTFKRAIHVAQMIGAPAVLIVEDDCVLGDGLDATLAGADLPDDWELLYLGGQHDGGGNERLSPHLLRCAGGTSATHAVAYRSTVFDALLALPQDRPWDCLLAGLIQPRGRTYSLWPSVATQAPAMSTITGEMGGWPWLYEASGVPGE